MRGRETMSATAPSAMAAFGIPNTTEDASSCAMVAAPRRFISRSPAAPSAPIPVKRTPTPLLPAAAATDSKSTSTLGRWRHTSGPSNTSMLYPSRPRWTRICRPPGAMKACPRPTRSACRASFTAMRHVWSSLFANAAVKPSGMCWTTTTAGASVGSASRMTWSASGPPVDAPIAMSGSFCSGRAP